MQNLRRAVFAGLVAGTLSEGAAATAGDGGFVEDSELQFLARTYYFNRDYRDSPNNAGRNRFKPRSERNGYREEATQGLRLQFASGYTPGSLGFGLDAHAMLGLQLDSGG
ncbi:outer membrane porin, OprD family, partial [Pseudomonas aeruginosa]|nr:outer membrane porin, OprD family [Pseudomonas aeruginosa]